MQIAPEIETAAGHVGNLEGTPRALVKFRSGAAVDVFGLSLATSFLRAIRPTLEFGIAEVAVNVCSSNTSKNTNKTDGCRKLRGRSCCAGARPSQKRLIAPAELHVQQPTRAKVRCRANVRQDNLKTQRIVGCNIGAAGDHHGRADCARSCRLYLMRRALDGDVPQYPTHIGVLGVFSFRPLAGKRDIHRRCRGLSWSCLPSCRP